MNSIQFHCATLALCGALLTSPALAVLPPPALDADVMQLIRELDVPGVAVGIVKDDEIILAKGFGLRRVGGSEPVDGDTLFSICSNTKAFTAVTLAQLVDEGKIAWDDPVTKYLPAFQMYDPYVTREITIRDLLVHRSGLGLGAGDLLWNPPTSFTTDETVARVRYLKPASSFRSKFAYDNLLYVVAGQVVAAVANKPWERVVEERILIPVGMRSTNTDVGTLKAGPNSASPHWPDETGKNRPIDPWPTTNVLAACGMNSSAHDMARWMRILLDSGVVVDPPGVPRLYSQARAKDMLTLVTPISISEPPPALRLATPSYLGYALGFRITDYRGEAMATHNGTLWGYTSRVTLFPKLRLGIVVLTNQSHSSGARAALTLRIADYYLNAPPVDWISAYRNVEEEERNKEALARERERTALPAASKPSLSLERYAGTYSDAWLGKASIQLENNALVMRFPRSPGLVGNLVHWQYDTFIARWRDRTLDADAYVSFTLKPDGEIAGASMKAVSALTDFSFDFHDLDLRRLQ